LLTDKQTNIGRWKHYLLGASNNWGNKHAGKHKITSAIKLAAEIDSQHILEKLRILQIWLQSSC